MRGSAFFDGIRQIDMEIGGRPSRIPVFYYDATMLTAAFPARLDALRLLLPDPRFVPARLAPGLGLVVVSALEYRDTDIGPYNELAIAIVLNEPRLRLNLPGRALWDAVFRPEEKHAFIVHLPVTTEIALRGGVDFYNFPKFLAGIEFAQERDARTCRLTEGREHVLTLSADPIATPRSTRSDLFSHLYMDGQPQRAQFKMHERRTGTCRRRGAAEVVLGDRHPIARELAGVLVSRKSVQYQLTTRMEGVLFGPDHLTIPLIRRSLRAVDAATGPVGAHR